jgi:hypothetical protein
MPERHRREVGPALQVATRQETAATCPGWHRVCRSGIEAEQRDEQVARWPERKLEPSMEEFIGKFTGNKETTVIR